MAGARTPNSGKSSSRDMKPLPETVILKPGRVYGLRFRDLKSQEGSGKKADASQRD
jgi:hypothetical protein